MTGTADIPRLDVTVPTAPVPGLIRPGIEAALAGRAFGAGPENTLGRAVAEAVARTRHVEGAPAC